MGKSKSPKVEVTEYSMSEHFGICSGPIDALLSIIIKEKTAWTGELIEQASFNIDQPELFGGIKKEGGLVGKVHFFRGESSQLLTDNLAQKLGRPDGASCPAFRGLASLFFYGKTGNEGFLWSANTPFLPGVWAKVRRKPVGLNPDYALIVEGEREPRAICFAIDLSTSMNDNDRLTILKSAMSSVLNLIKASVESGVEIDLSVVTFGSPSQTITRRSADGSDVDAVNSWVQSRIANATDTDFRAGMNSAKAFFDATDAAITDRFLFFITDGGPSVVSGATPTEIAEQAGAILATMGAIQSFGINIDLTDTSYTEEVDNTPSDGVPVVDDGDEAGLTNAVTNALYPDAVTGNANPAHIIYECLTNTNWGMGSPTAAIDYDSFDDASLVLYAEAFGLSMIWTRQASIQDFVQEVLDHIQGVLFVDPSTGLLTLKLIRGDYDAETLPVIDPDNADLTSFSRKLWGDIVNEIVVTWTNPENEQEETITAQDLASIATQGAIVSDGRNYYGVRSARLAQDLAYRDLRSAGQPLATCEAEVDRTQWRLRPASVLKVTWPEYGISELVMRVTSIDYGKPGDPTIKLSLMEDVYGLDVGSYDAPPTTEWVDPTSEPTPIETVEIFTLPLFLAADTTVAAFVDSPEYPEVLAGILATTDNTDTFEYELWDDVTLANGDTSSESIATNNIIGRGELAADLDAEALSAAVSFDSIVGQTFPTVGGFAIIGEDGEAGNEIVLIDTGDYDLIRGVLDTVPRAWPAGTPVWFVDGSTLFEDPLVRSAGETVDYKLLPRTSQGLLPYGTAPFESATLTERPWLPNRPANVQVNGVGWSSPSDVINAVGATVTVIWANRNRLMEDSQVLSWTDSTMTPEAGQTTLIEVLDPDENLLTTHSGLTGTTFVVPGPDYDGIVRLRVWSERTDDDGYFQSLQYFEHWVLVATSTLLATPDDELNEPQFILLSGDATDGDDKIELSGDAA